MSATPQPHVSSAPEPAPRLPRVAIQGELGAFSHQAALNLLGDSATVLPRRDFTALFAAVVSGEAERALVPIENSLVGSIHENYDRLAASPLHIVGETRLRIRHCLITRPGATLASVKRVTSHPVALGQCRDFFTAHPKLEPVESWDTAGSVRDLLRNDGPASQAAIASSLAATLHGGKVLIEGIEDDPQNYTRFLLLAREPAEIDAATKTSALFRLANRPGALHRALTPFAERGVDLSKLESRPLKGRPWEYAFYLDALGDPRGPAGAALAELQSQCTDFRILGQYPEGLAHAEGSGAALIEAATGPW